MTRPPTPTMRRYRGRIRADIRSTLKHLVSVLLWDQRFRTGPFINYPNQLLPFADAVQLTAASTILLGMLNAKGPIPSRLP